MAGIPTQFMAHHVANHLFWGPDGWLYGCLEDLDVARGEPWMQ